MRTYNMPWIRSNNMDMIKKYFVKIHEQTYVILTEVRYFDETHHDIHDLENVKHILLTWMKFITSEW